MRRLLFLISVFLLACNDTNDRAGTVQDKPDPYSNYNFQRSILSVDERALRPLFWPFNDRDEDLDLIRKDISKLHPLALGAKCFSLIYDGMKNNDQSNLERGKKIMDFLITEYTGKKENKHTVRFYYPFDYNEHKAFSWWSGMANSSIALASLVSFQAFNDTIYLEYARKSLRGVYLDIDNLGSGIQLGDSLWWFLEYAQDSSDVENSYFVLNGFLYALLTVRIFDLVANDEYLSYIYKCGKNSLKEKRDDFFFENDEWTYYMANPRTIEPPHYSIFDFRLLSALSLLDEDEFFRGELDRRRIILNKNYPLEKVNDENGISLFYSCVGPPNPYEVDVYPILFKFNDREDVLLTPLDRSLRLKQRAFARLNGILNTTKVQLFSIDNGDTADLGVKGVDNIPLETKTLPSSWAFDLEAETGTASFEELEGYWTLGPGNMYKGVMSIRGILVPHEKLDLKSVKYFAMVVKPQEQIKSVRITVYDDKNKSSFRYYVALKSLERNLILIDWKGFRNSSEVNFSSIAKIKLDFYLENQDAASTSIVNIFGLFTFENNISLWNYLGNGNLYFQNEIISE